MDRQQQNLIARRFNSKSTLGERIYTLRKGMKLSQRELASKINVSHVTISQWESSDTNPKGNNLIALGFALHCSPNYLAFGIEPDQTAHALSLRYPILTSLEAGMWNKSIGAEQLKKSKSWLDSDALLAGEGFWMRINSNSMASLTGLSVAEGSLVLFDTERPVFSGDLVLAKPKGVPEPVFRQIVFEGGIKYLRTLNPAWPMSILDDKYESVYVAIETRFHLVS